MVTPEKRKEDHIFGPVPSRRLGRSLGIDLVPFKTCTYDCVYCQLGKTTNKTLERREWIEVEKVIEEAKGAIERTQPDYVTISGSGEPTLNSGFGRVIEEIKSITDIPVALLTNGSLFYEADVRDAACMADLVIPSLDAGTEESFRKINRPADDLDFGEMVEGLLSFRDQYKGPVWLEIFLLAGMNAVEEEIIKMIELTECMKFDRIQLNTVRRPPYESYALPVPPDQMLRYSARFGKNAEVIADFSHTHDLMEFKSKRVELLELIKHRPCTLADIENGLGIHPNEALKYIEEMLKNGEITTEEHSGRTFYVPG